MTPLFAEEWQVQAVAPFRALDKLARRGIFVYDVQKIGTTCLKFRAKSKESEKIFAIFRGSCYTVKKCRSVRLKRLADALARRPGILAGVLLFFALGFCSNLFVLDIRVEGSGARYEERAVEILRENGLQAFAPFGEDKAAKAGAELLGLRRVCFADRYE